MPTYTFKNNTTGLEFDEFMGMSERETYLKDNPTPSYVFFCWRSYYGRWTKSRWGI